MKICVQHNSPPPVGSIVVVGAAVVGTGVVGADVGGVGPAVVGTDVGAAVVGAAVDIPRLRLLSPLGKPSELTATPAVLSTSNKSTISTKKSARITPSDR